MSSYTKMATRVLTAAVDLLRSEDQSNRDPALDDECPTCGHTTQEPDDNQFDMLLTWSIEDLLWTHGRLGAAWWGCDNRAYLGWCPVCARLALTGYFKSAWVERYRNARLSAVREEDRPALTRHLRDQRILAEASKLRNPPPGWWLQKRGYPDDNAWWAAVCAGREKTPWIWQEQEEYKNHPCRGK